MAGCFILFKLFFIVQVNDAIIVGEKLVSCSSDTTIKVCFLTLSPLKYCSLGVHIFHFLTSQVWNCFSDGACTRTLRQHSDYVICLAAAEKNVILSTLVLFCGTFSFVIFGFTVVFVPLNCRAIL